MNKIHHPHSRAERLHIKYKKEIPFDKFTRSGKVRKRAIQEIEEKELGDELRIEVSGS